MTQLEALPMRPYQVEAVEAVERAWSDGTRRPATVMATGTGKTVMFAHLVKRWLAVERSAGRRGSRALVLAHRTELVDQAVSKIHDVAPALRVGVVKADRNETLCEAVVGSVQTLASDRRRLMLRDVGLVVVDECHHAMARTYLDVLRHFGCYEPVDGRSALAVGYTATMARADGKALGDVWQDIVYTYSVADGVRDGYLVRPHCLHIRVDDLDLSKVRTTAGDYDAKDLGEAMEDSLAPEAIVKALREHAADRPTILFAPLVSTAHMICETLHEEGFTAAVVSAATPPAERRAIIEAFRRREIQILCNAMLFTEGTDLPLASCVVIARPTKSKNLFIQMVGRGLRPDVGKIDALVMDMVGASRRASLTLPVELFGEQGERLEPEEGVDEENQEDDLVESEEVQLSDVALDDAPWRNGPLAAEMVDLFHGSDSAWMRTRAGVWFVPAGDRYIAILPAAPGRAGFDVVAMHRYRVGASRWVMQGASELSYAMAWAEADITMPERLTAAKDRSWRARRPSEKQAGLARQYGIALTEGMHSGEVSNMITVAMASARIDARLPEYAR